MSLNHMGAFDTAYTHAGTFHFDDILCTAFLKLVNKDIKVHRVACSDEIVYSDKTIVYDIGGGEFDHHLSQQKVRAIGGIPYSSFGLIWAKYGKEFVEIMNGKAHASLLQKYIDANYVVKVDAIDNFGYKDEHDLTEYKVFLKYKPYWYENNSDCDRLFKCAVKYGESVLRCWIREAHCKCIEQNNAKAIWQKALQNRPAPNYIVLDRYIPCKALFEQEIKANNILMYIYKSNRSGYALESTDTSIINFAETELICKKETCFVHKAGFIMVVQSLQAAQNVAKQILISKSVR